MAIFLALLLQKQMILRNIGCHSLLYFFNLFSIKMWLIYNISFGCTAQ